MLKQKVIQWKKSISSSSYDIPGLLYNAAQETIFVDISWNLFIRRTIKAISSIITKQVTQESRIYRQCTKLDYADCVIIYPGDSVCCTWSRNIYWILVCFSIKYFCFDVNLFWSCMRVDGPPANIKKCRHFFL